MAVHHGALRSHRETSRPLHVTHDNGEAAIELNHLHIKRVLKQHAQPRRDRTIFEVDSGDVLLAVVRGEKGWLDHCVMLAQSAL